ncbi:retinol dehydrogenase 8-like [Amphiura filiformis]|uniref:retinol dehydrogenase 8-like n=1 Tax=Amphiura filiformis TaxID=82378 RepID=UPI003B213C95
MASQVVLITGCSRGIGLETALYLAKDPQRRFKVYATMRNMATNQEDLKTQAGKAFDDTLFIREVDVTKQDTIDKTVKEIVDREDRIDILVNNAGWTTAAWWQTAPMDTYYDMMEINFFGCVRMTRAVVPHMKAKRSGKILQFSSVLGFRAIPSAIQYIASKFALEGFSESIAPPLRKFNVWVSLIQPGYVMTPMVEQFGSDVNALWDVVIPHIPDDYGKIIREMVTSNPDNVVGTTMQNVDEITKLVEEIILSPKPDFRYQTSELIKKMARERFTDPTGNKTIESWLNV